MVETQWPELGGKELRYRDHTWELTGEVAVHNSGDTLALRATQTDGIRGEGARLHFEVAQAGASLNPGNLGQHFDRLERDGDRHALVIRKGPRRYRYELQRMEYE